MSGSLSAKASTSTSIKTSKFKPAIVALSKQEPSRRPALPAFCTPGFHVPKAQPHIQTRPEVVYISSDSAPSTPGRNAVKRDSSGFSIPDELSPPSKRLKASLTKDKENIFRASSKPNVNSDVQPRRQSAQEKTAKYSDLAAKSPDTLKQHQIYCLGLRNYFAEECLAFHTGRDTEKDMVLVEEIRELIRIRLQEIEKDLQTRRQINAPPGTDNTLPTPIKNGNLRSHTELPSSNAIASHQNLPDIAQHTIPTLDRVNNSTDGPASDDDYWQGMEDIPMHDATATIASGSSKRTSSKTAQSNNAGALISSPHYPEIIRQLRSIFKLSEFRTNQLEAVTAALEGKDVFVLMPTGGGKSLCYQLPAICSTGKTKGVTIVVSPLLALMKDQVESLTNKNIDALLSNSETVGDWQRLVVGNRKPSLWYLTPEKLRDNPKIDQILSKLYQGENLARFVIDEAHCISTWGQDFRDAYTALGSLRDKYPSVPIMALTATANQRTVADIITQLKLRPDRASFTQSFNRTNLNYIVRVKKGTPINEMVTFINTNHKGQAGVIYCTARHTCESVANTLRERGVNAAHFHAGMATAEKDQTVRDWQSGTVPVIVATIAFGMGIDKADVRYVIHYDMPKSLSGYYQETGRAGRDGKPADCLMFYSGSDLHKLRNQIRKTEGVTEESMKRQETAVEEVFQFCRKTSVCRRVQILRHFDEDFDKKDCAENCDTCKNPSNTVPRDVTVHVRDITTLVRRLVHDDGEKVTFAQIGAILRGSNTAEVRKKQFNQLPEYGSCSTLSKDLLELIFDELLFLKLITKVATKNASGFHTEYLDLGEAADPFMDENQTVVLDCHPNTSGKEPKQRKKATAVGDSISAPVRSRKGKKKATIEDDPIEDVYDDLYDMNDLDLAHLDDIPSLNASSYSVGQSSMSMASTIQAASSTIVTRAKAISSLTHAESDPEETLYKKMLALRNEIMIEQNLDEEEVFEDVVLQYLSLTCPCDYNSFKKELLSSVDREGPESVEYANTKWTQFGQRFLQLCIRHKTGSIGMNTPKPAPQAVSPAALLHSRYDYQPPAHLSSKSVSTPTAAPKSKSKFKPALPS